MCAANERVMCDEGNREEMEEEMRVSRGGSGIDDMLARMADWTAGEILVGPGPLILELTSSRKDSCLSSLLPPTSPLIPLRYGSVSR